jgi:AcrR family transcriptional regulator
MPKKSQREDRIGRIMKAMQSCLLEMSFEKTTLMDIARRAKINQSVLYYFYKTKEDILLGFIDHILEGYKKDFITWMGKKTTAESTPTERCSEMINFLIEKTMDRDLTKLFIGLWSLSSHNPKVRQRVKTVYADAITIASSIIASTGVQDEIALNIARELIGLIEGSALLSILFDDSEYDLYSMMNFYKLRSIELLKISLKKSNP